MKVIDLLNKMRLFNDYRPNIDFKGKRYLYDKCLGNYSCGDYYGLFSGFCIALILDEEIEIIEEKTKEVIDEPKVVKEVVKKETSNEKQYIKKTYLISQDNIDLIEGLALYTGKERKEVVEELLEKAINLIDSTIIEKALKEVKKSKKEEITKEIF